VPDAGPYIPQAVRAGRCPYFIGWLGSTGKKVGFMATKKVSRKIEIRFEKNPSRIPDEGKDLQETVWLAAATAYQIVNHSVYGESENLSLAHHYDYGAPGPTWRGFLQRVDRLEKWVSIIGKAITDGTFIQIRDWQDRPVTFMRRTNRSFLWLAYSYAEDVHNCVVCSSVDTLGHYDKTQRPDIQKKIERWQAELKKRLHAKLPKMEPYEAQDDIENLRENLDNESKIVVTGGSRPVDLMTLKDAAKICFASVGTLKRQIKKNGKGLLTDYRLTGKRKHIVSRAEVAANNEMKDKK
jgi:hypothetical protein